MNNTHPMILAIDCSSTYLGWCLYRDHVIARGEQPLAGDISARCAQAYGVLYGLLSLYGQPDALAIEAPVAQFAKAVIPQSRVAGGILTLSGQRDIPVVEVAPAAAKLALAGSGNADKRTMLQFAAKHFGHDPLFLELEQRRGLWAAWMNNRLIYGEHAADALGVALASLKLVRVEAA